MNAARRAATLTKQTKEETRTVRQREYKVMATENEEERDKQENNKQCDDGSYDNEVKTCF